ncbi:DNA/RNA-binding protein KIN17 [Cimex lectularius]|uniref:DNA/RNA-binding protein Kin17 WH-like domain-containing protein n=1 Tax=Cimex lectularius TaxID=79782 RepID=A0A8I6RMI9_CIMLE|nr:DNA/RNA-binding protein KIN17 [Cimex lectularius]
MGKHEPGTPKYIANKIKAKGLQKLRWYCQMCQKQCRDENGFKCHITSESHQRQLLLFADNQNRYLGQFSKEFADGYLDLLKRRFGTKRVHANRVYQEYISDRHHLHMNSTRWVTLTGFVKWLGREGKCIVDETEKGWFVTYIDRDPETIRMQEAIARKEKMDKDDNERMMEFLEKQIERGKQACKSAEEHVPTDLVRNSDEKITLELPVFKKPEPVDLKSSALAKLKVQKKEKEFNKKEEKRKSALDEIMEEEERRRSKVRKRDYWLETDIVVKVVTKSLGEKYENKKGVVEEVIDKYVGVVRMFDTGAKLKLDQAHLETVIPAIGRKVKILNGAYRGVKAELLEIFSDRYCVDVKIASGPLNGKIVKGLPYEEISKLNT